MVEGFLTNLSVMWEEPAYRDWIRRLGTFARVIRFDKRGMGLSDRVEAGTLEERMDDVRAVMDAVGSQRAAVFGESEGGPLSMLFAATYPQRTVALILCGAEVKEEKTDDWPWGEQTREEFEKGVLELPARWHDVGFKTAIFAPSVTGVEAARVDEWSKRLVRESASPSAGVAFFRVGFDLDIRDICPTITTPTLVVHRV